MSRYQVPDGSRLMLGNSPKGMRTDGGGALYRVADPRGSRLEAVLVRRFLGLKPEGVALAPGGAQILVVFDRDRAAPAYVHLPIPH